MRRMSYHAIHVEPGALPYGRLGMCHRYGRFLPKKKLGMCFVKNKIKTGLQAKSGSILFISNLFISNTRLEFAEIMKCCSAKPTFQAENRETCPKLSKHNGTLCSQPNDTQKILLFLWQIWIQLVIPYDGKIGLKVSLKKYQLHASLERLKN